MEAGVLDAWDSAKRTVAGGTHKWGRKKQWLLDSRVFTCSSAGRVLQCVLFR